MSLFMKIIVLCVVVHLHVQIPSLFPIKPLAQREPLRPTALAGSFDTLGLIPVFYVSEPNYFRLYYSYLCI